MRFKIIKEISIGMDGSVFIPRFCEKYGKMFDPLGMFSNYIIWERGSEISGA